MIEQMTPTVSQDDLHHLITLVDAYRERTGESISALALRAGVHRGQLNQLITGSYIHAPQFEFVSRLARAVGLQIQFVPTQEDHE